MIELETGVEVPEQVRGIAIARVDDRGAGSAFNVGRLKVRPRYYHNFGERYSLTRAMYDRGIAVRAGDVDPDTPSPRGGSTTCYLEEPTVHGFAIWATSAVLCAGADQYSRPAGRARALKRALIQLARHLANEVEVAATGTDAERAAEEEVATS